MAGLFYRAPLSVAAEVAWDFLDRYSRAEVHVFSACMSERMVGGCRVVTIGDGRRFEIRRVTVVAGGEIDGLFDVDQVD